MTEQMVNYQRQAVLWLMLLLLLSPLRAAFVLLVPFVVWWFSAQIPGLVKFERKNLAMTILLIFSSMFVIVTGFSNLSNIILTLWITYPILLLFYSPYVRSDAISSDEFINISTKILIVVNVLGILFYFYSHGDPDAMGFGYGRHFASQNGLAILNAIFLLYYLNDYWRQRLRKSLFLSIFFLFCFILCECGLALLCFILSVLIIVNLHFKIKYVLFSCLGLILVLVLIFYYSVDVGYYMNTFEKLMDTEIWEYDFRKLGVFINYVDIVNENPLFLSFGIGPGGYNSRIAFLLNTDADNFFKDFFGNSMPFYHAKYVQPLWDKGVLDALSFNDGSRNKPFSSFLSITSELGVVMMFLFLHEFYIRFKEFRKSAFGNKEFVILFSLVFFFLMLLTDQWFETSEMCYMILFWYFLKLDSTDSPEESEEVLTIQSQLL